MTSFENQVAAFLMERPAPCTRDVIIEDTMSLMVTRWKNLWIKTPEKDDWVGVRNGYLNAYALGFIDNLWIDGDGFEIITLHVEGCRVNHLHIHLLEELWDSMEAVGFFLTDWNKENIIYSNKTLKVIDWGSWDIDKDWARVCFLAYLEELNPNLKPKQRC